MDIDVSLSAYLNTKVFTVIINAAGKKEELKIQFGNTIPKYAVSNNDIFSTTTVKDTNTLKEFTTKNGVNVYQELPLPKCLSMNEFLRVIGFLYGVPLDNIRAEIIDNRHAISFVNDMNVIGNTTCVGDHEYTIYLTHYPTKDDYHYTDEFMGNYTKILAYIKELVDPKINKLHLNLFTNRIVFRSRMNTAFKDRISLPRLFNSLHVSDMWKKVLIHDDILDDYYRNPFPTQYVKSDPDIKYPFKGTKTTFNTVTIYINDPIHDGITLTKLDVNKYGDVSHTYTIINTTLSYEESMEIIQKYIKEKFFTEVYDKLELPNCIDSTHIQEPTTVIDSVSTLLSMKLAKKFKIESLSEIILQDIPELKYSTKTSISMNGYAFFSESLLNAFTDLAITHQAVGEPGMKKNALPNIICSNYIEDEIVINVSGCDGIESAILNTLMLLMSLPINDAKGEKSKEMTAESIAKRCMAIPPKALLKMLEDVDHRTFGPRYVKGKIRPYSGLSQKANQRVVPISLQEYEIVKKVRPESVANIENQTTGARLCLFCPHKLAPYINFHYSPGEICIPKCTLKQSNKQQYALCAEQLNIDDKVEFDTVYENQTIVLYNPLISPGRRCRPPEEFSTLLSGYVLLKVDTTDIFEYTLEHYDIQPYVIQRNTFNQFYTIYTEYDYDSDYCLSFKSELDDSYMIVVDESNNKLLKFSGNKYIETFFKNNAVKSNTSKNNLFNHIGKLLRVNLSDQYVNTTDVILRNVNKEYGIKFVYNNDYIVGIIHKNIFYCTPLLYAKFIDKTNYFVHLFDIASDDSFENSFPDIDTLNKEYIDAVYKDYLTDSYRLIVFDGIYTFVKKTKQVALDAIKNTVLFDYDAYKIQFMFINVNNVKSESKDIAEFENIVKVLVKWLVIFIRSIKDNETDYVAEYMRFLKIHKVITPRRNIVWSANNDYVLWRSSTVTEEDVKTYIESIKMAKFDDKYVLAEYINHALFRQYSDELIFHKIDRIEKITSKKITM